MNRFPDGARVCFVGDSITHNNRYVAHILAYYREHFPEAGVEFYNCGTSGATLRCTLNGFDEDIRPYDPTHVVLMMGVNDSGRTALNDPPESKYDALLERFETFKSRLDTLSTILKEMGAQLIICTPPPYAEYIDSDVKPLPGASALLLGYADYLKSFAREHGYPLCDQHTNITRAMQLETIYRGDRVHLLERGHYYLAKGFLAFQGLDLGEEKELPADVQEWDEHMGKIRSIFAAEHFVMHDDFTSTTEQRKQAIAQWLEEEKDRPDTDYYKMLYQKHQRIKDEQQECLRFCIEFMKHQ